MMKIIMPKFNNLEVFKRITTCTKTSKGFVKSVCNENASFEFKNNLQSTTVLTIQDINC